MTTELPVTHVKCWMCLFWQSDKDIGWAKVPGSSSRAKLGVCQLLAELSRGATMRADQSCNHGQIEKDREGSAVFLEGDSDGDEALGSEGR